MTKPCITCPNRGNPHNGACRKFRAWFMSNVDDPICDNKAADPETDNPRCDDPEVWRGNVLHRGINEVSIHVDDEVTICSDCDDDYYSGIAYLTIDEVRRIAGALNRYLDTVKEVKE